MTTPPVPVPGGPPPGSPAPGSPAPRGPMPGRPLPDVVEEAERVVDSLAGRGVTVRLLGGVGVAAHRHGPVPAALLRSFGDIDLVTGRKSGKALAGGLTALGYTPNDRFNALHGARRMLFYDTDNSRQMDVFVGEFAMCHRLDLDSRLSQHPRALAPADLLLTKLQIVQINHKDIVDAIRLLLAHEVGALDLPAVPGQADVLSLDRLIEVTRADWGWYTTLTDNLAKVRDAAPGLLDEAAAPVAADRIASVAAALEKAPKTTRWRARAMVGRRAPWYELPEEVAGTGARR
jgi:hypothetical protein